MFSLLFNVPSCQLRSRHQTEGVSRLKCLVPPPPLPYLSALRGYSIPWSYASFTIRSLNSRTVIPLATMESIRGLQNYRRVEVIVLKEGLKSYECVYTHNIKNCSTPGDRTSSQYDTSTFIDNLEAMNTWCMCVHVCMCVCVCVCVCVYAYLHLPHPEKKQSDSELARFQRSPESYYHSCFVWNCH